MTTDDSMKDVLNAVFEQGRKAPQTISLPDRSTALITRDKDGGDVLNVIPFKEADLLRIEQRVTLHDEDSLIKYLKRFGLPHTKIFARPGFLAGGQADITAIIDYHEGVPELGYDEVPPPERGQPSKNTPQHVKHFAVFPPRHSEEWARWNAICNKATGQEELAEFFEECRVDIQEPHAAPLLDIVRTMKVTKDVSYDSLTYQPNGSKNLTYKEDVKQQTGGNIANQLPEKIKLGIPVYFRGPRIEVEVFVRYKLSNGKLLFTLKIDRPDRIENHAFETLLKKVSDAVDVEVFYGTAGTQPR